ncbi:MAG TPA: alkaline phosphatase family protein [Pyrinomonadaceae bacterium]|nr:alkaline phosphatase family protein [Pyrinomonadaceae bacterium]
MSECCQAAMWESVLAHGEETAARDEGRVAHLRLAAQKRERPRRLLLCLDGVPFEVIRAAQARGVFERFNEPARLLSPFPTMTNVALAQVFRASEPEGYESLYFDRDARRLAGGVRKYIGRRTPDKIPSSYMDELDYQEPLAFEFLIYVASETVWRADMRLFRERFLAAPPARDFFGFLKATDGLLHKCGPERLNVALRSLDKILREVQDAAGSETEVVLFSDHGMNLEENRRVHLQSHLRRYGFEVTNDFRGRAGRARVSAPAFGLCSYAAVYCAEETAAAEVSHALSNLEGVDFSVRRGDEGRGVFVEGEKGAAVVERREGADGRTLYRYGRVKGDPLALASVARELEEAGLADAEGFAPDSEWLARTATHTYPDALANLYASLHAPRVRQTADVLVSLRDGYYYGASAFGRMIRLAATHGNALRASSTAFMMSTHRRLPDFIRAADARPVLKD